MRHKNLHKVSVYDMLLIGSFVILPILSLSSFWQHNQDNKESYIYQSNKLSQIHSLDTDKIISISDSKTNVKVEIKNGKIRIIESNCPKHICIHTGWIDNSGQTIVCVPNKLMIEVRGKQKSEYHAETY